MASKLPRRLFFNFGNTCRTFSSVNKFPKLKDHLGDDALRYSAGSSEELLFQFKKQREFCLDGGGEKGRQLHVVKNRKVLPRDRLKSILDSEDDYLEIGLTVGLGLEYGDIPAGGIIVVIGKIHGRYYMVTVSDATVKGGTFYPVTVSKGLRAHDISLMNYLPSVAVFDSGGAFLPLQSEIFADRKHGGRSFYNEAVLIAAGIPHIALTCGPCTAGGAYGPTMCEDSVIADKVGAIFLGGPPLVKAATGEIISSEDLGGAQLHCSVSGVTDYFAATEEEGFDIVRDIAATVQFNPVLSSELEYDDPEYDKEVLNNLCGLDNIDKDKMYGIIGRLVDGSRFREFKHMYGSNLITGYGFIRGSCIGVLANTGPVTKKDALKGAHFIQICNQRSLPLLFLQNSGALEEHKDFVISLNQEEHSETLKARAIMIAALSCSCIPRITVLIGSCHGDDNYTMSGPSFSPNFLFAWPGACVTHTMNPPVVSAPVDPILGKKSSIPGKASRMPSSFEFIRGSAFDLAARNVIDGVLVPSLTRKVVAQCLNICAQKHLLKRNHKAFPVYRM